MWFSVVITYRTVYIYIHIYIYVCLCMQICIHVYVYIRTFLQTCVSLNLHVCMCVHNIYIICIYLHTHSQHKKHTHIWLKSNLWWYTYVYTHIQIIMCYECCEQSLACAWRRATFSTVTSCSWINFRNSCAASLYICICVYSCSHK